MNYGAFILANQRWVAGGLWLTFCSSFGQTFFISLFGAEIRADFGLSHGEFGGLYMLATLASAATLSQLGRIVDHWRLLATLVLVFPALAVAGGMMAWTDTVLGLGISLYGLRLFGQGMLTHIASTAMGRWYSGQRGMAVSLVAMGHQLGEAVFPLCVVMLLGYFSWRSVWWGGAVLLLVLALPVAMQLLRVPRQPRHSDPVAKRVAERDWTRSEVVRTGRFWGLCLVVLTPAFVGTTLFFHQDYLETLRAWPSGTFATAFVVMAVATILSGLVSGVLIDRYSAVRLLPYFLLPLALACTSLWGFSSALGAYVSLGILGMSYGFSSALFGAIWPELYGVKHLGSIRALVTAMMVFSSALGPGVTGILIDWGVSYLGLILAMGGFCLAGSVLSARLARER